MPHRFLILCIPLLTTVAMTYAQRVPEPPLPGEEGPVSPGEAFALLPPAGDFPQDSLPATEEPTEPPPPRAPAPEDFPDIPPLVAPDDEEVPPLPALPGLTPPRMPDAIPRSQAPGPGGVLPGHSTPRSMEPDPLRLASSVIWYGDPRKARKASIQLGRPLLLCFSHSASINSAHLTEDLLAHPDFKEFAAGNIVLSRLEYSSASLKGMSYDAQDLRKAALDHFKSYYKVKGFPCAILFDETGREMTRISGYTRLKNPQTGESFSGGEGLLDRLREATKRWSDRRRAEQEKEQRLTADGFRLWRSHTGSTLMAKLVESRAEGCILMDASGRRRGVRRSQLTLWDVEWARRKQLEYDARSLSETKHDAVSQ